MKILSRPYVKSVSGRFTGIIFYGNTYDDSLRFAAKGTKKTLDIMWDKINILETAASFENISDSYTGVHRDNIIVWKRGQENLFEGKDGMEAKKICLNTADDFILMGNMNGIESALVSLVVLRSYDLNEEILDLIGGQISQDTILNFQLGFKSEFLKIAKGHHRINFHLNVEAMYPYEATYPYYINSIGGKNGNNKNNIIEKILSLVKRKKHAFIKTKKTIFKYMPHHYAEILAGSGLNISFFADGFEEIGFDLHGKHNNIRINIYCWSSTKKFDQFLKGELES